MLKPSTRVPGLGQTPTRIPPSSHLPAVVQSSAPTRTTRFLFLLSLLYTHQPSTSALAIRLRIEIRAAPLSPTFTAPRSHTAASCLPNHPTPWRPLVPLALHQEGCQTSPCTLLTMVTANERRYSKGARLHNTVLQTEGTQPNDPFPRRRRRSFYGLV